MTELSRFQKDVEVAASALEMRAENEDAREEAIHLYRKFGSTKQEPLEVFLKLAEEWRRPAALMGLLHLKKEKYGFKEKKFEL